MIVPTRQVIIRAPFNCIYIPGFWTKYTGFYSDLAKIFCLKPNTCRRPSRYVPYKGTFVPYDGTYGAPDQGQTLDV